MSHFEKKVGGVAINIFVKSTFVLLVILLKTKFYSYRKLLKFPTDPAYVTIIDIYNLYFLKFYFLAVNS